MRQVQGKGDTAKAVLEYSQQDPRFDHKVRASFKKVLSRWERRRGNADLREQLLEIDELRYELNRFVAADPSIAPVVTAQVISLAEVKMMRAASERAVVVIRKPAGIHKKRAELLRAA